MGPRPNSTAITTFQSGHPFTSTGTGGTANLNDASSFAVGTQSASRTTDGSGSTASLTATGLTAIDMTRKHLRLLFRVSNPDLLHSFLVYAGNDAFSAYYLWDALENTVGNTDTYIQTDDTGYVWLSLPFSDASVTGSPTRSGITAIRVAFNDKSTGAVTVNLQSLELMGEPSAFPNGVISLTWDDGFLSQWTEARRAQSLYNLPATAYPIADGIGADNAVYMTLAELHQLEEVYGWEIAGHSKTFAAHNSRFTSLSSSALALELIAMKQWLLENGFKGADHLAWPGGIYTKAIIDTTRTMFTAARSTMARQRETLPPADPYRMRVFTLAGSNTLAMAQAVVDAAKAERTWVMFVGHKLDTAAATNQWAISDYDALCAYIAASGVPVRTVGDVLTTAPDRPGIATATAANDTLYIDPEQITIGISGSVSRTNINRTPVLSTPQAAVVGANTRIPAHWKAYSVTLRIVHTNASTGTTAWLWRTQQSGNGDTTSTLSGGTARTITLPAQNIMSEQVIETSIAIDPTKPLTWNLVRTTPDTIGAVSVGIAGIVLKRTQ